MNSKRITVIIAFIVLVLTNTFTDTLKTTEHQVTSTTEIYETTPVLGQDSTSELLVYLSFALIGSETLPGQIFVQRIDTDGLPIGPAVNISNSPTNDVLPDVSGSRIVYTAYDTPTSLSGTIKLFDLDTLTTTQLSSGGSVNEARIYGDKVVWVEGYPGETRILYINLSWPEGVPPVVLAGPSPPATNVEIGERYIVWDERVNMQFDVWAYDYSSAMTLPVANDPNIDERRPSTSGSWVVYEVRADSPGLGISARNLETAENRTIVNDGYINAAPTIHGDLVAWEANTAGNFDIYLYRISDAAAFQVTNHPANQQLSNISGDKVAYVDYRDNSDIWISRLAFIPETNVTGPLAEDTTWSGIIHLTGDVTVPEGITLTILPGTKVMSESYSDDQHSGNQPSLISLEVRGTLIARGSPSEPILFTSTGPGESAWDQIRFIGTGPPAGVIQNVIIENANVGIHLHSGYADIINNTLINNFWSGVMVHGADPTIKNNIIVGCSYGINVEAATASPHISYNDVYGNTQDYWDQLAGTSYTPAPGTGNISLDPQFVDAGGGDYRLQGASPCVDAGDPSPMYNDVDGTRNNMGAYGGAVNSPPVADAGPDKVLTRLNEPVILGTEPGRQSYDPDNDPIAYQWTLDQKPGSSSAVLVDPATATPGIVPDVQGDYVIGLIVTDIFGAASPPDSVMLSFNNVPPVADAGGNQAVRLGDTVILDGTQSSDANGDPLTYRWSLLVKPTGSVAVLSSASAPAVSFEADVGGSYTVRLVVNDGFVDSDPDYAMVLTTTLVDELIDILSKAVREVNNINPNRLRNINMANPLTEKINAALELIEQGFYSEALDKLENDILKKTDGCANRGLPDNNDWIRDCQSQSVIYSLIMEAIDLLKSRV